MNERYRLIRPLASGGMAELFLGVARGAEGFERPVAIKRVLPHLARDPDIARMFLAEARLSTLLQHQNIATVHDVGQGPEGLFLVMELVDGWDLGVLLASAARRGIRFPPQLAAFIVHQCLAGLGHAYRKVHDGRPVMMAHRDVSPSNILVSREGEVKLTDFGIARMAGPQHTAPGIFRGKEAYSAPEVLRGEFATAASDQFSLGIVFHELLTGQHPFHAEQDASAVAYAILTRPVAQPRDVPGPLAGAMMRMLAPAPSARFHSPESLSEGFARWLAQAGVPATSQTLAAFMRELGLPPTLREQAEAAEPRPEIPRPAHAPYRAELEEGPLSLPGGPALSSSGRMVHRCMRCQHVLPAPGAPCGHCPAPVRSTGAPASTLPMAAAESSRPASRAASGPRMELSPQQSLAESVPQTFSTAGMRSVLQTDANALELAERAPPPDSDWPDDAAQLKRKRRKRVVGLLVALGVLAGGIWLWPQRSTLLIQVLSATGLRLSTPTLTVESEPPGAAVWVDDTQLGTTPLRIDNRFPTGRVSIQVRLKGYRTWKGTFTGGAPASLEVKLKR